MKIALLAVSVVLSAAQIPDDCLIVPKGILDEPRVEFTGRYTNSAYRFSVIIPDGLTGYDGGDPSPHHGFGLILDPEQSYLYVDGSANSLEDHAPRDAANRFVRHLRQNGKAIESTTVKPARLGDLPAAELVVNYRCGSSPYVTVSVFGLSPDREMIYEVTLQTFRNRAARDRVVLDRLIASWRYIGSVRHWQ